MMGRISKDPIKFSPSEKKRFLESNITPIRNVIRSILLDVSCECFFPIEDKRFDYCLDNIDIYYRLRERTPAKILINGNCKKCSDPITWFITVYSPFFKEKIKDKDE